MYSGDFNSIKVRLELSGTTDKEIFLKDFNSIKVRLEPSRDNLLSCYRAFQFHKGAIRTGDKKRE